MVPDEPRQATTDPPARTAHPEPSAIERHMVEARATLDRVAPEDLGAQLDAGALVVDIRPEADRRAEGGLDGAVVIERIHLEWRLDPTSPDCIPEAVAGRRVVIVCNEGYSSVLAATSLVALGVDATDLDGGYRALVAIGSPLVRSGTT